MALFGEKYRTGKETIKVGQVKIVTGRTREYSQYANKYAKLRELLIKYNSRDLTIDDNLVSDYIRRARALEDKLLHLNLNILAASFIYLTLVDKYNLSSKNAIKINKKIFDADVNPKSIPKYDEQVDIIGSLFDQILDAVYYNSGARGETSDVRLLPYKLSLLSYVRMLIKKNI